MNKTLSTDNILILWLLAASTAIVLVVAAAHTTKVAAPAMQWQSDSSWVKSWKF